MDDVTIKAIPGEPGYHAGSDGTIWSSMPGRGGRYKALHVMRAYLDRDGYPNVTLRTGGKRRRHRVQQLVARTFLGARPHGLVVCHLNGTKTDNRSGNLRYDTVAGNTADRWTHGTMVNGDRSHLARITETQALEILRRLRLGEVTTQQALAKEFGISPATVSALKKGRIRRHLTVARVA